jgi:fatty acid desaturase
MLPGTPETLTPIRELPDELPAGRSAAGALREQIRSADAALVARNPWLGRDDAVAMALFVGAFGLMGLAAAGWLLGPLPAAAALLLCALALSTLHELEHDLIHDLYLRRPLVQNAVLFCIWVAKANLDPWSRGRIHRWHHVASGQPDDIEERLIGLGLPWGPRRLALTLLPAASGLVVPGIVRDLRARARAGGRLPDLRAPRGWWAVRAVNAAFLGLPLAVTLGWAGGVPGAREAAVLWVLPGLLRHSAIVLLSSNSHYTGIPRGDLLVQNQVLDHPLLWPAALFCWNFGATHVLHHVHVQQPFWRRTLVYRGLRPALRAAGLRFNDLGSFGRANRWAGGPADAAPSGV